MSVEVLAGTAQRPEFPQLAESKGWSAPGVRILVTGVALCIEQATQQVVNTGSLYQ